MVARIDVQPHQVGAGAGGDCAPRALRRRPVRPRPRCRRSVPRSTAGSPGRPAALDSLAVRRDTAMAMPSSGAPDDTGQSEPNASARARLVEAAHAVLLVGCVRHPAAGSVELRPSTRSSCAHSGCMFGMTPKCGEAVHVGVVDQLRVRDHRAAGRAARWWRRRARSHPGPGARPHRRWRGCGSGSPARRPAARASARLSSTPACRGCAARRAVRRQQRAGLVLDDPVGEELHRCSRSAAATPHPGPRRRASANCVELRVEVARIGVERQVEPHAAAHPARAASR